MNWTKVEKLIGESVPNCVKTFLSVCAYDTLTSIQNISLKSIEDIENHMSTCTEAVQGLDCCHAIAYKTQKQFKLLPGHKDFLLSMCKYKLNNSQKDDSLDTQNTDQNSSLPVVLQAMIQTSQQNAGTNKHHAHYNDLIRYFSTYVFLLAGRSCYEFLRSNLELPSTKTVCKFKKRKSFSPF